jgi:hypothetical protein
MHHSTYFTTAGKNVLVKNVQKSALKLEEGGGGSGGPDKGDRLKIIYRE